MKPNSGIKSLTLVKSPTMNLQERKLHVMQKMMNIQQNALLLKIEALLEEEMIVAYTTTGEPLTKSMYDKRLAEAENQIDSGTFISQEDLEKESEQW